MRMLFTCRPLDGHFQPMLPLAEAARARGHEVVFATAEPVAIKARAAGFRVETAGLTHPQSLIGRDGLGIDVVALPREEIRVFNFGRWFSGVEAPPRLADLTRICADIRPDIVVHEGAELAGPLAAARAGIPWVTVGFGLLPAPELSELAGDAMAPFWKDNGLAAPRWGGLYRFLYVDPYPPTLQIPASKDLPATVGIRPPSAGLTGATTRDPIDGRVYVTFGTVWNTGEGARQLLRHAVAGSADAAQEVIVTVGRDTDPALLDPQPSHVEVRQFIPQDDILANCAGMVSHGGSGTLLGALSWRVPSLLLPQRADQFHNAERAMSAGVALALQPSEVTREAVADRVRQLLETQNFAPNLLSVWNELASAGDAFGVLDRIEALRGATI